MNELTLYPGMFEFNLLDDLASLPLQRRRRVVTNIISELYGANFMTHLVKYRITDRCLGYNEIVDIDGSIKAKLETILAGRPNTVVLSRDEFYQHYRRDETKGTWKEVSKDSKEYYYIDYTQSINTDDLSKFVPAVLRVYWVKDYDKADRSPQAIEALLNESILDVFSLLDYSGNEISDTCMLGGVLEIGPDPIVNEVICQWFTYKKNKLKGWGSQSNYNINMVYMFALTHLFGVFELLNSKLTEEEMNNIIAFSAKALNTFNYFRYHSEIDVDYDTPV